MLTPAQIDLVKTSWEKVVPIAEQAAEMFYSKLFSINPELKLLFNSDMKEQGRKLMAMLNTAVNSLDKLDTIVPVIQESGRRHLDYGVEDKDYDTVGEALLWTLSEGLAGEFTDEVRQAWVATYTLVATTMKEAAAEIS